MKKALGISLFVIILLGLLTGAGFLLHNYFNDSLKGVNISITRNVDDGFINYEEIYNIVVDICDTTNNKHIISIPVDSINKVLWTNPWVTDVRTLIDLNSVLNVQLVECEPIVRIYNDKNKSVYIDEDGDIFPVDNQYVPRLLIGNGFLDFPSDKYGNISDEVYLNTDLPVIFEVMKAVLNNDFSRSCVKQVYFDKNKNFKFSMNNTDIIVIFGDDNNIDDKLVKMEQFFLKMQGNPELDNFKEININFNNQVVCTKHKLR